MGLFLALERELLPAPAPVPRYPLRSAACDELSRVELPAEASFQATSELFSRRIVAMFCHEKLDVDRKTVEFLGALHRVIRALPPGNSDVINQLRRAVMSIPLYLAEVAGKTGKADKQRFYSIARGSALECAAILDLLCTWHLVSADRLKQERALLEQIVARASALALK